MKAIVIMSDSLRRDHLGCYGNRWIKTPNLDALARQAAVFQHAYGSSHPTLPNRTDLFTGRWGFPWHGWGKLAREETVLAQLLTDAGVVSMLIGDTYHLFKEDHYYHRGFSGWYWNRGQEGDNLVIDPTIPIKFPCKKSKMRLPYPDRYAQICRNRYHRKVETDWFAPGTMTKAMEWLEANHGRDSFLLWIDLFDPHEPWDPPQHYIDLYDPDYDLPEYCDYPENAPCTFLSERELKQTRARYAGEVTMVDTWVGRLMDTLANLQLDEECLVVFMADHGHYLNYPTDGGLIGKPLSYKGEFFPMYRSLNHLPFLVRLPGARSVGKKIKGIVQPPDLLPTLLDYFGLDTPACVQGESFMPLLKGTEQRRRKFALGGAHRTMAQLTNARWSFACWRGQRPPALYDLKADPNQERNLAPDEPETVRKMHGVLLKMLSELEVEQERLEQYQV